MTSLIYIVSNCCLILFPKFSFCKNVIVVISAANSAYRNSDNIVTSAEECIGKWFLRDSVFVTLLWTYGLLFFPPFCFMYAFFTVVKA